MVEWRDIVNTFAGGRFNFQVRLHETTNVVELAYGACRASADSNAQVGLRGSTNNDFINRMGTWTSNVAGTQANDTVAIRTFSVPANGLLYTYTPPAPLPCAQPFSLAADTLGPTSLYLAWRVAAGGGSGPFTVRYGPTGFNPATPGAGSTTTAPAGATGVRVGGLTAFTRYDFYVTQDCGGAAGTSPRSQVGRIRTTLANDDPNVAEALPITATCVPVAGTTAGANTSPPIGYAPPQPGGFCTTQFFEADVWYTFTTPATGPASQVVQISTTNGGASHVMIMTSPNGPAGPFTAVACDTNSGGFIGSTQITYNVLPSTTYYVRVAGDYFQGPFTICATTVPGCGQPLNAAVGSVTATTATLSFTPSSGGPVNYVVTVTPQGGGTPRVVTPAPTASPVLVTGLTPGTRYSLNLQANCGSLGQSAGLPLPLSFTTPPPNDTPATAQALPLLPTCQPTAGTILGAGDTPNAGLNTLCTNSTTAPDVWYTFTTDATGPASTAARVEFSSPSWFVLSVGAAGPGGASGPFTLVNCSPDTRTASTLDLAPLLPSTTYYVRVWRKSIILQNYAFTICVRHPLAPVTCAAPVNLAVANVTPTSAEISWLIPAPFPAPTAGYMVTVTPQGGPATVLSPAPTASPVTLPNLVPGTNYTVSVTGDCGPAAGQSLPATVSFRTPGPPPNDLCFTAAPLACGQTLPGSARGATVGGQPATACQGRTATGAGVWYAVQGTGQTMSVRTCLPVIPNPPYMSTQLFVYGGSCTSLTCVATSAPDTTCGSSRSLETVSFAALAGQTYYVLVNSPSGVTRDFILTASCGPLAVRNAGLAAQVGLFPNPAHRAATLTLPAGLTRLAGGVRLSNALGQLVREYPALSRGSTELDLTGLAAGVYTLRLTTAQGPVSKRLLVE